MESKLKKVSVRCTNNEMENTGLLKEDFELRAFTKPKNISMEFTNLSFYIHDGHIRKIKKNIIQNLNGYFPTGNLISILGPSGSGKTSLLGVLSGYVMHNISGQILVNGKPQDLKTFQYNSSYIQQDNISHSLLTVQETMKYAADFKLGPIISTYEKNLKIQDLLKIFNIENCVHTQISKLSGGEKKRLSIALELINNPSIIFLDEPTSGLDSLAASQCIKYLKFLTTRGTTIVCTIHQPSASIFYKFDHVYILSDGRCLYQGNPHSLVPYLKELDLECPQYYNPADFVIDLASGEYGQPSINKMIGAIDNGNVSYRLVNPIKYEDVPGGDNTEDCMKLRCKYHYQFNILLQREFTKAKRNLSLTYLRLIVAVTNSLLLGIVFWQVGDDGSKIWFNYNGILGTVLHFMMPSLMLTVLYFPTEIPVIQNELFNKWYSFKAYYLAICTIDLPISILYCIISSLIIYPMTGQPMELYRFEMWFFINFLVSLVAQSLGLLIGSVVSIVNGAFVASAVSFPFLMLAGFGITYRDLSVFFYTCTYLSYLRYGVEGILGAVYGYNRKPLQCPNDMCFYKHAQTFLEDMYLSATDYWFDVTVLLGFLVGFKVLGYYGIKWKLQN